MAGIKDSVSIEEQVYRKILDSKKKFKKKKRAASPTRVEIIITGVISIFILLFAIGAAYYYNIFINLEYNIQANLAQTDTQLQKRKNLIINLGTTVVEYTKHEREIFTYLGELRTATNGGNSETFFEDIQNKFNNNDQVSAILSENPENWEKTLSGLMAVAEQYPDLKLSENLRAFMDAILEFEESIAQLRMIYNSSVNEYSTIKDQFPGCVFALLFRSEEYSYFQVDEDTRRFIPIE